MDAGATGDQRELLDVSRRFIENTCPLRAVRDGVWRDDTFMASYRRQAAELGWFSMFVPESLGGGSISGNGALDAALIGYHRGRGLQPGAFVGTNVVAAAVAAAGSDGLRASVLPSLVAGDVSASWAASSSGGGGRVDGGVVATPRPGGGFELNGRKAAVDDVETSSWLLVTCTSGDGPVQALVPAGADGISVVPVTSLDLTRRFADVVFDGVHVAADALVGEPGTCEALIERQRAIACTLITAEMVGAMDRDFETTVQYAKDRIAFGRPIGSFQGLKHQLADTSLALEMSRAVAVAAARTVGTDGDEHGPQAASMAKAFVSDAGIDLVQTCFQVFGGIGYTWEHDQHLFLRRVTMDAGSFGDGAWHCEHLCQLAGL